MSGYLLDTNVVSETRKVRPDPDVTTFLQSVRGASLYVSVITVGELRKGAAKLWTTDPGRAALLDVWIDGVMIGFADRVIPIDAAVSRLWGELSAVRSLPVLDTLIAATAIIRDLTLVTRNVTDVATTGVRTIDPWQSLKAR